MIHRDSPRTGGLSSGQRVRLAWLARLTMAIALLAAVTGPMATQVAAQSSAVDDNTYTSPDYDWAIEWDEDFYMPAEDFGSFELVLWGMNSTIFFQTLEDVDDAEHCLDIQVDALSSETGVDDFELLEDEDGNEIEELDAERSFAAYSLVYTDSSGNIQDRVNAVDCHVIEEGETALSTILITYAEAYEDEAEAYDDLIRDLELPQADDEEETDSRRSNRRDADETPEVDDEEEETDSRRSNRRDADETPEADEEEETDSRRSNRRDADETPEVDDEEETDSRRGSSRDADEDEEEETDSRRGSSRDADETPEVDDEDEFALDGVDGNFYESPSFGYTLEWDEDIWFALLSTSERDDDFLALVGSNGLTMFIWGLTTYDDDIVECFEDVENQIADRDGIENLELLTNSETGEGMLEADNGLWVAGFYVYEQDGEEMASYVQCIALEDDGAVIQIEVIATMAAMQENVASIDEVINTLVLP